MKLFELYNKQPLREDKTVLRASVKLCESVIQVLEGEGDFEFEPDPAFAGVKGINRDTGAGNRSADAGAKSAQSAKLNQTWVKLVRTLKTMNPAQAQTLKANMQNVAKVAKQKGLTLSPSPEQVLGLANESVVEDDGQQYGVYATGGSVGGRNDEPYKTFDNKADASEYARRMRKQLSPGERQYYKMGYSVRPIK